jgi:hypothetical protein
VVNESAGTVWKVWAGATGANEANSSMAGKTGGVFRKNNNNEDKTIPPGLERPLLVREP